MTAAQICAVLLQIAHILVECNSHDRVLWTLLTNQGQDPRHISVKVAARFSRLVFQEVSGRQILRN